VNRDVAVSRNRRLAYYQARLRGEVPMPETRINTVAEAILEMWDKVGQRRQESRQEEEEEDEEEEDDDDEDEAKDKNIGSKHPANRERRKPEDVEEEEDGDGDNMEEEKAEDEDEDAEYTGISDDIKRREFEMDEMRKFLEGREVRRPA
jgi:phage-related minor tail protein